MRRRPWVVLLVVVLAGLAFVYLGPDLAFSVIARAVLASIVYRLVRRLIR